MVDRNTKIRGTQIFDDTISPAKMQALNSPVDGFILEFDSASSEFRWIPKFDAVTETPAGSVNGSNKNFTLTDTPEDGSLAVYLNGLYQEEGSGKDYILSGTTITFTDAPLAGDIVITSYVKAGSVGAGSGTLIQDGDENTKVETEQSPDENIIRFTVLDTQEAQMDVNGLTLKTGASVNELSTDGTLAGDSDDALPTEQAVKTYVDTEVATKAGTYTQSFDNGDLSSSKITITHSLGINYPMVMVYDNSSLVIVPTEIKNIDTNNTELDFTGLTPISGTYNVRIVG